MIGSISSPGRANQERAIEGVPHFLIVGACKSGTTTLYDDLALHPEAALPDDKEPDILHKARSPNEAVSLWSRHFRLSGPGRIRGEASTMYSMVPEFPDVSRLARQLLGPNGKIVYIMRHPVDRIESHLAHDFAAGRLEDPDYDRAALEFERYESWSDYPRQIAPWIEAFGRENVMGVIFEEYVSARHTTAMAVAAFVGLDPARLPQRSAVSNPRGHQRVPLAGWISQFINSGYYRHGIRPLLPTGLIRMARRALTRDRDAPPICLREATRAELRRRLAHVPQGLRQLGIEPGWW